MLNPNATITVSWEVAKYFVNDAAKGDANAILPIIRLACPDWADVKIEDFKVEMLGGGFSGNVPFKCSAKQKSGSLAFKVIPPEEGGEYADGSKEATLCETACNLWSMEGIVPKVYLIGNSAAPGIEIYEFIEGKCASWIATKHGAEFLENEEDAASFARLVGKLHSLPTEWYEPFKNDAKPQWESWQEGTRTNKLACERREKYGDYAATMVLFVHNFSHHGKNMKEMGERCLALCPLMHNQLSTDICRKIRVCHGDLHGGNLLHREKDGHGDLVAVDLDFVGYNPTVLDLSVVLAGTMSGPYGYYFLQGEPQGAYPSYANRRLVAATYLESLSDAKSFSTTNVDDIIYDMEIGGMLRILWATPILSILGCNKAPNQAGWGFLHYAKAAYNIFEQCKTNAALKRRVIEEGVAKVFTERMLELGLKPINLTVEEYKKHWDIFGKLGPDFSGPFLPDDPEPDAEETELEQGSRVSHFQAATFKFHESTGADIRALFDKFDSNKNGTLDLQELLGAAALCGVGFRSMDQAEEAFSAVDTDGDGVVDFDEFKSFLQKV